MMKPLRNKTPSRHNLGPKPKTLVKDPVEVFCRIRPLEKSTNDLVCVKLIGNNTVQLLPPDFVLLRGNGGREANALEYTFRHVFDDAATQKEVFDRTALGLVEDLVLGKNGLIFTYGVTSSGKTYTMTGTPSKSGLLPRTFDVLFNAIKDCQAPRYVFKPDRMNGYEVQSTADVMVDRQRELGLLSSAKTPKQRRHCLNVAAEWAQREIDNTSVAGTDTDTAYSVFVSYVEIYNNHIFDLLEEVPLDQFRDKVQSKILRTDAKNNMYVNGTTETEVKSSDEALEVFLKGQQRRRVAHTALNTESSRSHSVFTLRLVQAPVDSTGKGVLDDKDYISAAQLSLVDLAGSERTQRTRNTGNRLKEAGNINNSLMVLRQCIEILREKQANPGLTNKIIPYRDNKLTLLFKSFFEGEGRIRMIVCAHPGIEEYDETLQVMKFAEMTQEVLVTRPIENTPKIHFTRGRREFQRQEKDQGANVLLFPYSLGPPFPSFHLNAFDGNVDTMLANLEQCLTSRAEKRIEMKTALVEAQNKMRTDLLELQKENSETKPQLRAAQMDLEARELQLKTLERKVSISEQSNDLLRKRISENEQKNRILQHQLSEKNYLLNRGAAERVKMTHELQDQLEAERERMQRVMQHRLAAKQAELEDKMSLTSEKFRMLKEIINTGAWDLPTDLGVPYWMNSTSQGASISDSQLNKIGRTPAKTESRYNFERGRKGLTPASAVRGIPAANPRHRRSASADVWVEHVPAGTVETGTVLKSVMKKKRSVSKLEENDMKKEASKYVLTHQEQDCFGDLETKLFKGDIIPSAGGGAQVIFSDVEVLHQMSPPSPRYLLRKRSAEAAVGEDELKNRCKVAMEGKSPILPKKLKH